ncbi:MAG: hypothetical protein JO073_00680 [Actinobacteria bacterium]|nr:hypothetical protein [Actinomycetota bacterium]
MRVLILFCEEGEGHAAAARVLARELADAGAEPVVEDAMTRGLGRVIPLLSRDAYHVQVRRMRWTYGVEYWFFTQFPPGRRLARWGLALLGARPLLRVIRDVDPDLVVSTHPAVTCILGHLRRRGRLRMPAVATVTDFGVHALWAHPGVDLHLVMHEGVLPAIERFAGRGRGAVVAPIVAPEFRPHPQAAARRTLGLPPDGPVVLVSGGGWGVGALEKPVGGALAVPGATVVCLTGRNELVQRRLEKRFGGEERLRVVPFTDRMPDYLAAADALVDSSLGVTCLEALEAGCRIVACGAPPGHSRDNARALQRLGLAEVAWSAEELTEALWRLLATEAAPAALPAAPPAADAILAARALAHDEAPRRHRRRAALATLAAGLGALVLAGWTFASPTPYPVVARMLDLEPLTQVRTTHSDVALVVVAPAARIPSLALDFERRRMHVSFAVEAPLPAAEQRFVAAAHDGLVPLLEPAGARVLRARTQLEGLRRNLALGSRFYYLAPPGFTLTDYVVARAAGGLPCAGSARQAPGSVVVVDARGAYGSRAVAGLASSLAGRGIRAVPLSRLLAEAKGATRASASAPRPVAARPITIPTSRAAE